MAGMALVALVLAVPVTAQPPLRGSDRAVEVRVIEFEGFRWEDAAIGALAGFGLAALLAGVFVATGRKKRSSR